MSLDDKPQGDLFDDYHNNPEYQLFDSVINEFTDIGGFPIYYGVLKVDSTKTDDIYGEDQVQEYTQAYQTRIVYEPTEEEEILSSFGMSSQDVLQYTQIPKSKFQSDVAEPYGDSDLIPKPGDVIQLLGNGKLYQVSDVGSEQKIFRAKKLVGELICRPYTHSEESESADDVLHSEPPEEFFDEDNTITETQPLSAHGDNEEVEDETYTDPDSMVYGYE